MRKYIARNRRYIRTAYAWHGGQASALYAYASTGGHVQHTAHLREMLDETHQSIHEWWVMETQRYGFRRIPPSRRREIQPLENFRRWLVGVTITGRTDA